MAMVKSLIAAAAALSAILPPGTAGAQSVEQFYKSKAITLTIPTSPGGINDISGRLIARHLAHFIPGKPNIVAQNQPGAGGLAGANVLYNAAEKDGSAIAMMERAMPQFAIMGDPNAKFDPLKFTWIGSLSSYGDDAYVVMINASHPVQTVADLKKPGTTLTLGANRSGSTNLTFALIAKDVLGLNINVVRGYQGAAPIALAQQRNEVDGQVIGFASIRTGQPDLWYGKKLRPLIQFGRTTRHKDLPDVPTGRELTTDRAALSLIEFAELPFQMALPLVAPPGIPADRAAALRQAFQQMVADKAFLDEAAKLGLEISPITGEEVRALLERSQKTPKDVIEQYKKLAGEN